MSFCPNCQQPILADDIYCGSCGSQLSGRAAVPMPPPPVVSPGAGMISCPSCGHMNEADSLFCEQDGTPLQRAGGPALQPIAQQMAVPGILVMPDRTEMTLPQTSRVFGRSDLIKYLKPENAKEVSRAHFTITQENGVFYLQDGGPDPNNPQGWKPSVNRTSLNGVPLDPGVRQKLSHNDVIDVASLGLNLTFKAR